uniref:G-protein coupled receptors family 1 profile domain-containing protein n=1 Tax=Anas platyrhynchos TaxID=8839 RepID=A0A8B9TUP2_ANAPL
MNGSVPGSEGSWQPEAVLLPLAYLLIFLVGTVGNCLVLAVLLRNGQVNNTTNLFILNLGVADLCFILFCVPFQATIYTLEGWVFGPFLCKAVHFFIYLTMYASSFTLATVSLDSYYQQFQLANLTVCHPIWDAARRKAMDLCTFVFSYLVPVLILGLTYTRTIRYLWSSVDPLQDASESKAAKRKVTRMIIIVAVLFCLCWLPHHLLILYVWFGYFPLNHATYVLRVLSHLVSYANSCVNPIVYALVSKHFRKGFKKIFSCLLRKRAANKVHAAPATHTASTLEAELSELPHGLPRRCSALCQVPEGSWGEEDGAGGQQQGADGSFITFNVT